MKHEWRIDDFSEVIYRSIFIGQCGIYIRFERVLLGHDTKSIQLVYVMMNIISKKNRAFESRNTTFLINASEQYRQQWDTC
jgi:hypothetical protein